MPTESKMTGRAVSIPKGLAVGAVISMLATIIIAALGAHLIASEILPQEQIGYCSLTALITGSILGAIAASGKVKRRRLMVCLLNGLVYYMILLAITALFFGGQYQGMGVTLITICLGSLAAALITSRDKKERSKRGRKKIHH